MKPHWYYWQNDSLFLQFHVTTRARCDEFKGLLDNKICLRIKAPPVEGKANQYLLRLIAEEFKVNKSRVEIIAGSQSRDKYIGIYSPSKLPDWFLELTGNEPKNHGNF